MNSNPYKSPASVSSDECASSGARAAPWPKWMLRLLCVLFIIFGLASLLMAIITSSTSLGMTVSAVNAFGSGAVSLIFAALAIYGAARNYRIGVNRIRESRQSQNEVLDRPNL